MTILYWTHCLGASQQHVVVAARCCKVIVTATLPFIVIAHIIVSLQIKCGLYVDC